MVAKGQIYRHYKYDPQGSKNNYTYKVIGIGFDTEQQEEVVVYKPLYECEYKLFVRSLKNFSEVIDINGHLQSRFNITKNKS